MQPFSFKGLGELDRGPGTDFGSTHFNSSADQGTILGSSSNESVTQTLAPGRVPTGFSTTGGSAGVLSSTSSADSQSSNATAAATATYSDIMQLLLVHERRRTANQHAGKGSHLVRKSNSQLLRSRAGSLLQRSNRILCQRRKKTLKI